MSLIILKIHNFKYVCLKHILNILHKGFQNGNLALMDITKTNEYICILENAHSQQINSIAFNKSNTLIASSGDDKTTNIYSIKTYWQNQKKTHLTPSKMKPIIQIDVHRCEVTALAWSPTAENVLVIAEKKLFSLYDVETKDFTASVKIRAEISAIVWSSKYNVLFYKFFEVRTRLGISF